MILDHYAQIVGYAVMTMGGLVLAALVIWGGSIVFAILSIPILRRKTLHIIKLGCAAYLLERQGRHGTGAKDKK